MAKKQTKAQKKMRKVLREFKAGKLRSGSKHGPTVTSYNQAVAIGMSEAGIGKKKKSRSHSY